jgi:hypothetical protein
MDTNMNEVAAVNTNVKEDNALSRFLAANEAAINALVSAGFTVEAARAIFSKKFVDDSRNEFQQKIAAQNLLVNSIQAKIQAWLDGMKNDSQFTEFAKLKPNISFHMNDDEVMVDIKLGNPVAGKVSRSNAGDVREATSRTLVLAEGETVEMRIRSLIGTKWSDAGLPSQYKQFLTGGSNARAWNYRGGYYGCVLVSGVIVEANENNCASMIKEECARSEIRAASFAAL